MADDAAGSCTSSDTPHTPYDSGADLFGIQLEVRIFNLMSSKQNLYR